MLKSNARYCTFLQSPCRPPLPAPRTLALRRPLPLPRPSPLCRRRLCPLPRPLLQTPSPPVNHVAGSEDAKTVTDAATAKAITDAATAKAAAPLNNDAGSEDGTILVIMCPAGWIVLCPAGPCVTLKLALCNSVGTRGYCMEHLPPKYQKRCELVSVVGKIF